MPELIWYKRFPQDWMSDPQLGRCSPATRGIWADIIECCYLTNSAWLVGPTEELARVCRCSEKDFEAAVAELKKHKVGEFQGTEAQHKIGCRRIIRMLSLKDLKRKAGLVSAAQRQHTTQHNPQQTGPTDWSTRSASASVSASVSASENASESERGESKGGIYSPESRVALHFLNEQSGKHFRESESSLAPINARLKEPEVDIAGVRKMISRQCKIWKGTRMQEYLRPETLFGKEKFNSYYAAKDMPVSTLEHQKPRAENCF